MKKPLVGDPVRFSDLFRGPLTGHLLGLIGGCIWGLGTVFNLVAARFSGVAISYAIGQSAPMVAALWGVFIWKEFRGANSRAKMYLAFMFVFYALAIFLVSQAITAS
jgi:glucose uptake protein